MKTKFEDQLKNDFTSSTPDVLNKIKQDHRFKLPEAPEKQSVFDIFKLRKVRFTFASLFVVVLLAVVFMNQPAEQIYASTVTIDLNPQFEITLDEDDRIIDITALNNDGEEIIDELGEYNRQELQEVIQKMVQSLYQHGYLNNDENTIMVYVEGINQQIQERVQEYVENKLQEEAQKYQKTFQFIRRNNLDYTTAQLYRITTFAEENNIHPGRVILILEILDASDTYTVEDLKGLTMRELADLYIELYPTEEDPLGNNDQGNGNN